MDKDGDGCGDLVATYKKPNLPSSGEVRPQEDDEFNSTQLGPQWQFEGPWSHYWYFCDANNSRLRLYGPQAPEGFRNLSDLQNMLLQKLPTENFTVTARVRFIPNPSFQPKGEEGGFVIMGQDYAGIKLVSTKDGCVLRYVECIGAQKGKPERCVVEKPIPLKAMPKPYTQRYAVDDIPEPRLATPYIYARQGVEHRRGQWHQRPCAVCLQPR